MHLSDPSYDVVGAPVPGCQIKLVDVPEMNYLSTDNPPRGEIWMKGPHVSLGYYKSPEKTREVFDEHGWFATGDVGLWTEDGTLAIIDRVKNLVKLSHGEYIALEALEAKLKASPYLDNICMYGDSKESFAVALVIPNKEKLFDWAASAKQPFNDSTDPAQFEALCLLPLARRFILSSIVTVARSANLKTFEIPKAVYLCADEWTPANGLLTAALKLKRGPITALFKAELAQMYAENQS